jgi:hypothetical protein
MAHRRKEQLSSGQTPMLGRRSRWLAGSEPGFTWIQAGTGKRCLGSSIDHPIRFQDLTVVYTREQGYGLTLALSTMNDESLT